IEEIAQREPAAIVREEVEPAVGMQAFQARELAFGLGLEPPQVSQAVTAILGAYRAFRELDATMVEINPLVVTQDGQVLALDVKMSFDDNAMFRRPNVAELRDYAQEDPREAEAAEHGLNYVALDGNIGCIINGAGLAMATMDMIKHAGGSPANFLDVGGGASPDRVAAAFRLVLSDPNIEAMLVNIFAGINRCDWVAQGVVQATRETGATASIGFVPAAFCGDSIMEAANAGIRLVVTITDGIPAQDMMMVKRYLWRFPKERRTTLIGPNCAGLISAGKAMMGIMPG